MAHFAQIARMGHSFSLRPRRAVGGRLFATNTTGPFNTALMNFDSPPDIIGNPISSGSSVLHDIGPSDTIEWKIFGGGFDFKPNPLDASTAASSGAALGPRSLAISAYSSP